MNSGRLFKQALWCEGPVTECKNQISVPEPLPCLGTFFLLPVARQGEMLQPSLAGPGEPVQGGPKWLQASASNTHVSTAHSTALGAQMQGLLGQREMGGETQHHGAPPSEAHLGKEGGKASGKLFQRAWLTLDDTKTENPVTGGSEMRSNTPTSKPTPRGRCVREGWRADFKNSPEAAHFNTCSIKIYVL